MSGAGDTVSHVQAMQEVRQSVQRLLEDPFLQDLPPDVSAEEVACRLAVLQGRALTLHLSTYDQQTYPVVVLQGATVHDLMKAVEREVTARCRREGTTTIISWKYVWKSYWLSHGQTLLENSSAKLSSYCIGNHSEVTFIKKLQRGGGRRGGGRGRGGQRGGRRGGGGGRP